MELMTPVEDNNNADITNKLPRATRKEWIGLGVIALPCVLYSMDLTVLNFLSDITDGRVLKSFLHKQFFSSMQDLSSQFLLLPFFPCTYRHF